MFTFLIYFAFGQENLLLLLHDLLVFHANSHACIPALSVQYVGQNGGSYSNDNYDGDDDYRLGIATICLFDLL